VCVYNHLYILIWGKFISNFMKTNYHQRQVNGINQSVIDLHPSDQNLLPLKTCALLTVIFGVEGISVYSTEELVIF